MSSERVAPPPAALTADYTEAEKQAIERKKIYCRMQGICFKCWLDDPYEPVPIDRETSLCPNCDRYEKPVTCQGCREGALNQLGHIGSGGCLASYTDQ